MRVKTKPTKTTRKNSAKTNSEKVYTNPRMMPGCFIKKSGDESGQFKPRFSQVYKPAGLRFIKAFKVVYKSYFLDFNLLDYESLNLYNFLHFLADEDMFFTMRGLMYRLKLHNQTIRNSLDTLENCNLLHTLALSDMQGCPNYYVICTPLFLSKESLTQSVRSELQRAKVDAPKRFLVDMVATFRARIKRNEAKERRDNPGKYKDEITRVRKWNNVIKAFSGDIKRAVEFDRIIADAALMGNGQLPLDAFNRVVIAACKANLNLDLKRPENKRLLDLANEQRAFYDSYNLYKPEKKIKLDETIIEGVPDISLEIMLNDLRNGRTIENLSKQFRYSFDAEQWAAIVEYLLAAMEGQR